MYRLYLQRRQGGWEGPFKNNDLSKLQKKVNKTSPSEYYSYTIIKNEGNGDEIEEGR